MVTRIPVSNNKELVINVHLSAYDKGGIYKKASTGLKVMEEEYKKGSYIIVGGDFNHDIADSINKFPTGQKFLNGYLFLENLPRSLVLLLQIKSDLQILILSG